ITIPLQLVSELNPNGKTGSNYNYPTSLEDAIKIASLFRKTDSGSSVVINTVKSPVLMLSDSVISKITLDKQGGTGGSDYVYLKWDRVDRSTSGLGSTYYQDANCTTAYPNNTIVPPTKVGYTFMGYYTVTNGTGNENRVTSATGSDYNSGFKGVATTAGFGNEATVYASWTPTVYTIEYNLNGGTVTIANPTSYTLETPTFTLNNPTKTGYDFVGWTESDETTPQPTVTIEKGNTGDKTYTAHWKVHEYTIHFDGNGATSGEMEDQELEYDVPENLPKNEFVKTGYTFTGWKDETGNSYTDEQLVEKLTTEDGATITLTAQWKVNEYTIQFNGNGATSGEMEDKKFEYDIPENLPKNEFEKTGHTFTGWKDEAGNIYTDEQLVEKLVTEDGSTITLEAQWKINEYKLTVIPNGGVWNGDTNNQHFKMDFNTTKEITDPTRNGYTFKSWSLVGAGALIDANSKIFTMGYEDATLTAVWSINTYELTFDLNGGNINGSTDDITTDLEYQEQTQLTTPERDGYTFTGWDVTGTESSVDSDGVFTMGYEDATVTAQWTPNSHKITYHGVEGLYNDKYSYVVDTVYNQLITVDENKFYNDSFIFVKWNTKKDGSGTDYSPLDTFNMPDEDIILYAQWVLDGYQITYHANGGISEDGLTELTVNYATGSFATFEDCMFTREGYKFIGWGEDENVTSIYDEKMHMNGDLYLDGEDLELYAIWEKRDIGQIIEVSDNDTTSDTTTDTPIDTSSDTSSDTESDTESDEPIPEKPLYGDVNCNGVVNMEDVAALQKIMAKLSTHEDYGTMSRINSDCDHNDVINMIDVTEIQKFMAKLIPDLDP
ncbi:MAG: InlB B-repeat-containing protein, partial [Clostridia bacterium]|nr:InlB B-repeat-containing protein [Clostridia bacterium]